VGILEQLDYLQNLGINAIYFTPIFQSANHRYHTHDYYQVDPMLGNEAFQELLKACHQRNIKVVLDGVFNHSSRGFFFSTMFWKMAPFPWVDWFKDWWHLPNGEFPANYAGWAGNRRYQCSTTTILKCGTLWRLLNTGLNSASTAGA